MSTKLTLMVIAIALSGPGVGVHCCRLSESTSRPSNSTHGHRRPMGDNLFIGKHLRVCNVLHVMLSRASHKKGLSYSHQGTPSRFTVLRCKLTPQGLFHPGIHDDPNQQRPHRAASSNISYLQDTE